MTLKRTLRTSDAAWIVAGNMIGAGIFMMPGVVAGYLPGAAWSLAAWLTGGLLALAGAMVYGELGSRYPRAGGDYQYLREAFGPLPAFLGGWAAFLLTFSAAAAAMSIVAMQQLALASPPLARIQAEYPGACSAAVVLLLTAANVAGARVSSQTTLWLTVLPIAALAWPFVAGLGAGAGRVALPAAPLAPPQGSWILAFGNALVPVFFTYSGWNAAAYLGGEMKDAPRSLPRALVIGTGFVTGFYLLVNVLLLATLPSEALAGSTNAVAEAARLLVGPGSEQWLAVGIGLAILGSANVTLMAGARIYYAMACDGIAPAALARLNRGGVPGTALWVSGSWTALLAATAPFDRLYAWSTLAILLLSALTVAGLFLLRRLAAPPETYRCPFYPVTPVLYLVACLGVAVSSCFYDPAGARYGMALVLLGIPAYFVARLFVGRGGRRPSSP
jgi:APA family basic amino acid/polyamine antiporter